ncbi:GGDEF domain-containing protein [Cellulomonas sp. NS3]|uniref:GGDEF domain-containing protein n=1 Tax=Cellulomonas sp. NS3 TaxID=2973977 RepID=UPI002162D52A|nr:GGDEF domain-containing protein [Cellulomonas sp. NS3]
MDDAPAARTGTSWGDIGAKSWSDAPVGRWVDVHTHELFGPRDAVAAGRTASVMCLVGGVATVALETLPRVLGDYQGSAASVAWTAVGALVMVGLALLLRRRPEIVPGPAYTALCLAALVVNTTTSNLTGNSTFGGLAWFMLPVIFAAAHLRHLVAWTVSVLALVGSSTVILATQPSGSAAADLASMAAVVVMTTTALRAAVRHQDELVCRLSQVASSDSLTGLATRRVLEQSAELLRTEAGTAARQRSTQPAEGAGLVLVDLDRFKQLNDTHGHPVGDAALVHVAQLVRSVVRGGGTVARIGGDELAVLLPGPRDGVVDLARALHATVRETPFVAPAGNLPMTVSIGVAHTREPCDLDHLYAAADAALYEAKVAGRDRVVVADAGPGGPEIR